jgi:hypothetical protein
MAWWLLIIKVKAQSGTPYIKGGGITGWRFKKPQGARDFEPPKFSPRPFGAGGIKLESEKRKGDKMETVHKIIREIIFIVIFVLAMTGAAYGLT